MDKKPRKAPSARWLAVPLFAFGGAVLSFFGTFMVALTFISAGDFSAMIAAGFAYIGLIVGGIIGAIAGVAFARGTHHR